MPPDWSVPACTQRSRRRLSLTLPMQVRQACATTLTALCRNRGQPCRACFVTFYVACRCCRLRSASRQGRTTCLACRQAKQVVLRSEEHTSELQSLMRISYAVFCLKKKKDIPEINCIHNM